MVKRRGAEPITSKSVSRNDRVNFPDADFWLRPL